MIAMQLVYNLLVTLDLQVITIMLLVLEIQMQRLTPMLQQMVVLDV
jgi:hypothetical protein